MDFDHGVNTAINRLREALGDSAENPRFQDLMRRVGIPQQTPECAHDLNA